MDDRELARGASIVIVALIAASSRREKRTERRGTNARAKVFGGASSERAVHVGIFMR